MAATNDDGFNFTFNFSLEFFECIQNFLFLF